MNVAVPQDRLRIEAACRTTRSHSGAREAFSSVATAALVAGHGPAYGAIAFIKAGTSTTEAGSRPTHMLVRRKIALVRGRHPRRPRTRAEKDGHSPASEPQTRRHAFIVILDARANNPRNSVHSERKTQDGPVMAHLRTCRWP